MKKISIKVNRTSKIASLSLNTINDLDQEYQMNSLNRIAQLFISKKIYVAYIRLNNGNLNLSFPKTEVVTVKPHKWYDLLAIRIDNEYLGDVIKIFAKNDERTEIYYIDEFDWNKFLEQECRLNHNEYKAALVINDNGQTFINFNMGDFNLEETTAKINDILKEHF